MKTSFNIGEFSQITGLSVKTLRFYHERGILLPTSVDPTTGYRSYDASKIEKARVIMRLRAMEFSIEDIGALLGECSDDADILDHLAKRKSFLKQRIREDRDILQSVNEIIESEREARRILEGGNFTVEEKTFEPVLVAGIRMKGKYCDCSGGFSRLCKAVGRHACGKPLCLYYDGEYREEDAQFEPCIPIRKEIAADGISVCTLPGGRCLTLVHRGPYDQLGRSYAKILKEAGLSQDEIAAFSGQPQAAELR